MLKVNNLDPLTQLSSYSAMQKSSLKYLFFFSVGLNLGRIVDNKISPVTHDILGEDITFTIRDGDNEVVR